MWRRLLATVVVQLLVGSSHSTESLAASCAVPSQPARYECDHRVAAVGRPVWFAITARRRFGVPGSLGVGVQRTRPATARKARRQNPWRRGSDRLVVPSVLSSSVSSTSAHGGRRSRSAVEPGAGAESGWRRPPLSAASRTAQVAQPQAWLV